MLSKRIEKLTWWEVGLFAIAVSFVGGLSAFKKRSIATKIYTKKLKQAPWAPPVWAFAPAWTINNFFLLLALQKLLISKEKNRQSLLIIQAGIWAIFFSFNYVYFNRKSPMLAALWTMTDAALANISIALLWKENKKIVPLYLPLAAWTNFAASLAIYQALENRDPVFKTKALL